MDVKDIIIEKLKVLGADGLAMSECGCSIDDLAPCCDNPLECMAAVRKESVTAEEKEQFGDHFFVIAEIENGRVKR